MDRILKLYRKQILAAKQRFKDTEKLARENTDDKHIQEELRILRKMKKRAIEDYKHWP